MPLRTGDDPTRGETRAEARGERRAGHWPVLAGSVALTALALAWLPAVRNVVPACPSRWLLDLPCPACGTTRVLAALGRGALGEAVSIAPLPTLVALGLLAVGGAVGVRLALGWPGLPPGLRLLGQRPAVRWAVAGGALVLWGFTLWTGSSR